VVKSSLIRKCAINLEKDENWLKLRKHYIGGNKYKAYNISGEKYSIKQSPLINLKQYSLLR
jgi:hypothetical protein